MTLSSAVFITFFSFCPFRNPRLQGQPGPFPCPPPLWPALPILSPVPSPPLPSHTEGPPHFPSAFYGRALHWQWTPGGLPGEHHRRPAAGCGAWRRPYADRRPSQPNAEHAQHPGPPSYPHGHVWPGFLPALNGAWLWRPHPGQHGLAGHLHGGERQRRERRQRRGERRRRGSWWRGDEPGPAGTAHPAERLLDRLSGQHGPAAALGVVSVALRTHTRTRAGSHCVQALSLFHAHTETFSMLSVPLLGSLAHANTHIYSLPCLSLAVTVCRMRWNKRET